MKGNACGKTAAALLTIRKEQVQALVRVAIQQFEKNMLRHLKQFFPDESAAMGDEALREHIRHAIVGALSYGLRKRIDLGRALAMEPKVLLMDEPMAGMNIEEKEDMARFVIDIREAMDIPVVIIEHDMQVVMDIADRIYVLN